MKSVLSVMVAGALALPLFAFDLGSSDATIYAAKGRRPVAEELSGCLAKVFGKTFAVKDAPAKVTASETGIFVGVRPEGYVVTWDAKRDCSVRVVERDRVWLFGNDGRDMDGTANAVYDFLERFAGVRWLWPGDLGTVVEPRAPVALADETVSYVPPFERRMTSSFTYGFKSLTPQELADEKAWLRHRCVGSSLRSRGSGFQHAFASLLPREKYGQAHPDYYALVPPEHWIGEPKPLKPTRLNKPLTPGPWQLCTSNPEVRRLVAERLIAAKTDAIQSISPNDGYGFCECPACRAQDPAGQGIGAGTYDVTDRMYDFLADVAQRVYAASPESKVGLFSYSFYDQVPQKKFALPPNVYLSCCYLVYRMNAKEEAELNAKLTGLGALGAKIIGREYWGTHYTMNYPLSHSRKIDRNLKLLHRIGAAGIYGETGNSFAARATDLYILLRLSWDPTLKREDLLRDFCESAFGRAAEAMYDLFEQVEDCVERKVEGLSTHHGKVYEDYKVTYAEFNRFMSEDLFTADFFRMSDAGIARARKLADTPARKARVDYIARGFEMAKRTTESLDALADLASAGMNLPLVQPSGREIAMEKKNLSKVIGRAIAAERERRRYVMTCGGENAISRGITFGSDAVSLRPWRSLAEMANLLLKSDRYNYLVNGAFEYSGFSWNVAGKGDFSYTTARNRDGDYNVMVQCHHKQGISLQLDVAPGGEMTVRNLRKVSPAEPRTATLKLFVRCEGDPVPCLAASLGGVALKGVDVTANLPDADHWHEIRFAPAQIPAGDHVFELRVRNPGTAPQTFNFDSLDLRLGKAAEPPARSVDEK